MINLRYSDIQGVEDYIKSLPKARFIQPPPPVGYWEAPCDAPRCFRGTVRMYDSDAICSKCGGSGILTVNRLRHWLLNRNRY